MLKEFNAPLQAVMVRASALYVEEVHRLYPKAKLKIGLPTLTDDGWMIEIEAGDTPTELANEGADPHVIEARNAHALAFEWEDAPPAVRETQAKAPLVFFKRVVHPGFAGQHFLEQAEAVVLSRLQSLVDEEFANIIITDLT